jgi:hypothetical protein
MIRLRPEQVWTCNVTRHHGPLLSPSGSRNKLGTPRCNARRILLRHKARDESSVRNSVPCQSLATLQGYGTRQRYKCVPTSTLRSALFWDVTQRRDAWRCNPTGCYGTSVRNYHSTRVTSQKCAVLVYIAAEDWNHATVYITLQRPCTVQISIYGIIKLYEKPKP